jgi:hypothetical protein
MNRSVTQFAVALAAVLLLGIVTIIAVVGYFWRNGPPELVFTLVGALSGITGQASAYLFRLNGGGGYNSPGG